MRFPDAHKVVDDEKRTPLHYAALLTPQSPAYKNILDAGADERAMDKVDFITHLRIFS